MQNKKSHLRLVSTVYREQAEEVFACCSNQDLEKLDEELSQARNFLILSPQQQQAILRGGEKNPEESLLEMVRRIHKIYHMIFTE